MTLKHCDFCSAVFQPREWRAPSGACDLCFLTVQAAISNGTLPKGPDWSAQFKGNPHYHEPESRTIQ